MDTLFFIASKLIWLVVAPDSLLLILLLAGLLALLLKRHRLGKFLVFVPVLLFLLIALLPLDEWLAWPLEKRFPAQPVLPPTVDGIIVLGGSLLPYYSAAWDQPELNQAAERNIASVRLARHFPEARLVFSGGSGQLLEQELKEAEIARELYRGLGLDPARMLLEGQSRNTWENARYSKDLVNPAAGERWVLVTSAMHMPRAMGVFCQLDWPVVPYPVDHNTSPGRFMRVEFAFAENLQLLSSASHEWVGLAAYYLTGKTSALLPAGCAQ